LALGAGGNAINNMIGQGLQGIDFIFANTDAQVLPSSKADRPPTACCRPALPASRT
jgi:hypothetical protein